MNDLVECKAYQLREQGLTYPEIAKQCGYRSAQVAVGAARRGHAILLREQGLSYAEIARQCGYTRADSAWRAIHRKRAREQVEILVARIDELESRIARIEKGFDMTMWADAVAAREAYLDFLMDKLDSTDEIDLRCHQFYMQKLESALAEYRALCLVAQVPAKTGWRHSIDTEASHG
jgi:transcriptional regulator